MAQSEKKRDHTANCFKCGAPDHLSPNCPLGDIPKEEWWINKQDKLSAAQKAKCIEIADTYKKKKNKNKESNTSQKRVTWSGIQQDRRVNTLPIRGYKMFQTGVNLAQMISQCDSCSECLECPELEDYNSNCSSFVELEGSEYQFYIEGLRTKKIYLKRTSSKN